MSYRQQGSLRLTISLAALGAFGVHSLFSLLGLDGGSRSPLCLYWKVMRCVTVCRAGNGTCSLLLVHLRGVWTPPSQREEHILPSSTAPCASWARPRSPNMAVNPESGSFQFSPAAPCSVLPPAGRQRNCSAAGWHAALLFNLHLPLVLNFYFVFHLFLLSVQFSLI